MAVTQKAPPASRRWSAGRAIAVVAASVAALVALALLAGGLALAAAHLFLRDADGYYASSTERLETSSYALTADGGVGGWLADEAAGRVRVSAAGADGRPVFVGIARESDLDRYMTNIAHEQVTDVSFGPFSSFSYDSVRRGGRATPGRPAAASFWVAASAGPGRQTLEWEVEEGRWAVAVMNADGGRDVAVDVGVAARPRLVVPAAIALLAGGLLLLAAAGTGLWLALREGPR
jgi:hypothetical protein